MTPATTARILRAVSILYLFVGLVWATIAWAPIDAPGRLLFDVLDWPIDGMPATFDRTSRWSGAVGAGLLAGFAIMMWTVVAPELERGNPRIARGVVLALLGWFAIDGAGSLTSGVPSNALFNVPFLLLWLAPVLVLDRQARDASGSRRHHASVGGSSV